MEVNLNNIQGNHPHAGLLKADIAKADVKHIEAEKNNIHHIKTERIPQKTMMDLKDVQSFLYMMIGSEIKIEDEKISLGIQLNKTA